MIILLGPDGTGKTTLAHKLESHGLKYFHYTKDSGYLSYIRDMCSLSWLDGVLDRHMLCEYPYHICMNRSIKFSAKQWHNVILTTLIQNPVIILCTHKPRREDYDADQYLPYDKWDMCMELYFKLIGAESIPIITYDYAKQDDSIISTILNIHRHQVHDVAWWRPMWEEGVGCTGSIRPKVLLVAERIGPNNMHNIPFETGPTGDMLTDLLIRTKTPLGLFTVTNFIKGPRRSTRDPNDRDLKLLGIELDNLRPQHVVFMGQVAKKASKEAKSRNIPFTCIPHFGAYAHRGITSVEPFIPKWNEIINPERIIPL